MLKALILYNLPLLGDQEEGNGCGGYGGYDNTLPVPFFGAATPSLSEFILLPQSEMTHSLGEQQFFTLLVVDLPFSLIVTLLQYETT